MILQALVQHYDDLASRGEIARSGWALTKISYALCVNGDGELTQVIPLLQEEVSGKKTVLRPQKVELPITSKKASGIYPCFLWDNSGYLLGIDTKGNPQRSLTCFQASRQLHHRLLDGVDSPAASGILRFFDRWEPENASSHPALADCLGEVTGAVNLLFRVCGEFPYEDSQIRTAWQSYYEQGSGLHMQCLITGRMDEVELTHPLIRGVQDAQSSGAALVSFNAPAFCSYGREQNLNAPVGKHAAFAYTTALNHLLADRNTVHHIGDTTVVCWAEGAEPLYQPFACAALFGDAPPEGLTDNDLRAALKRLSNGLPCEALPLDPNRTFYILGLAPNSARLSVRFFLRDSFGALMHHVNEHYERMEIVRPASDPYEILPLWALLRETVNLNSRDKSPSPAMAGAVARSIFTGSPYPAALLEAVMLRIRAEREITRGRAAILKAYYLRNAHSDCPKEVLTVSLNESSTNPAYTLGRLFSVYEAIQQTANPGINTTIKDRYFNSAASTPANIFPVLDNLCQKHLRKLETGLRIHYDRQIGMLKDRMGEEYPLRMTLPQQGSFNLGYYHQTQKRYEKKES